MPAVPACCASSGVSRERTSGAVASRQEKGTVWDLRTGEERLSPIFRRDADRIRRDLLKIYREMEYGRRCDGGAISPISQSFEGYTHTCICTDKAFEVSVTVTVTLQVSAYIIKSGLYVVCDE